MSNQKQTPLDVWATVPFSDSSEMQEAIRDPRYSSYVYPNRYREAVEAKIGISEGVGTDSIRIGTVEQSIQVDTSEAGAEQLRKQAEAQRAFGEAMGDSPMALPPATPEPRKQTTPRVSPVHEGTETGPGY